MSVMIFWEPRVRGLLVPRVSWPTEFADPHCGTGAYQSRLQTSVKLVRAQHTMTQRILATDFENFEKGPLFRSYMKSLLGTGVFNADGEIFSFSNWVTG